MKQQQSKTSENSEYFNLTISGVGYLNDVRQFFNKEGKSFVGCKIGALQGHQDSVKYAYFDCIATGKDSEQKLLLLAQNGQNDLDADRKVFAKFTLSSLKVETFTFPDESERAGETGVNLKSQLIAVDVINIDGKRLVEDGTASSNAPVADQDADENPEQET